MLYFFILPAYLLFLGAVGITSVVLYFRPSSRHVGSYGFGVALGTVPGFLVANALLWLFTVGLLHLQLPEWLQGAHKAVVFVCAFLGPVPVSIVGILVGGLVGAYIVHRMRVRLSSRSNELPPAGAVGSCSRR
jgi:hypothetical protein